MDEDNHGPTSEFNSSLQKIFMLDNLEKSVHTALVQGDLIRAFETLEQIEVELDYKIKEKEYTDKVNPLKTAVRNSLKDAVTNAYGQTSWSGVSATGSKVINTRDPRKYALTREKMLIYFKQLKRIKQRAGLGVKEESDPRFAINES